jgi:DNA uptake protein ComE-like DNA-binding protein
MKHHIIQQIFFALPLLASPALAQAKPLITYKACTYEKTDWADGDSFLIKPPGEAAFTVRLYGADCMEWHISDESDARRLREQRRYFGITEVAPKAEDAIAIAKGFGEAAAKKTADLLNKPFTIHTHFRKALGDGNHERFYAFVECADGSDLAAELVKTGLARASGVNADGPDERSSEEYEKTLDDLELQSAKRGLGIWSKTNWEKLPVERKAQRQDDLEANLAIGDQKLKQGEKINPSIAARDELMRLPGIGEEIANRIIEKQPFKKLEDLEKIPGIGIKKLDAISPFLIFPSEK